MSVQNFNTFGAFTLPPSPWPQRLSILRLTTRPLPSTDPFADEGDALAAANQDVGSQSNYIHIRVQQRNGRKTLTTLQGLPEGEFS